MSKVSLRDVTSVNLLYALDVELSLPLFLSTILILNPVVLKILLKQTQINAIVEVWSGIV